MTEMKLSDFTNSVSIATSLANLDKEGSFTIIKIANHPFEDNGETTPGVLITTKEKFSIGGDEYSQFYTTRKAITAFLQQEKVMSHVK